MCADGTERHEARASGRGLGVKFTLRSANVASRLLSENLQTFRTYLMHSSVFHLSGFFSHVLPMELFPTMKLNSSSPIIDQDS